MHEQNTGTRKWPDSLSEPSPREVQERLLRGFWLTLEGLPDLVQREEHLLAANLLAELRLLVLEMMLALNGIQRPPATRYLNTYLSQRQRTAIEGTLVTPAAEPASWVGQAVSLVVIYRWYAPQLVERFDLHYPQELEQRIWQHLRQTIPDWPETVSSD